jgi:hypothetical protein
LPVFAAVATGSKATVLKSGMPLIPLFLKLTVPLDQSLSKLSRPENTVSL